MALGKRLYGYRRLNDPKPEGLLLDDWGNLRVEPRPPRQHKPKRKSKSKLKSPSKPHPNRKKQKKRRYKRPKLTKLPYGARLPMEQAWLASEFDPTLTPPWEDD